MRVFSRGCWYAPRTGRSGNAQTNPTRHLSTACRYLAVSGRLGEARVCSRHIRLRQVSHVILPEAKLVMQMTIEELAAASHQVEIRDRSESLDDDIATGRIVERVDRVGIRQKMMPPLHHLRRLDDP